MKKLISFLLSCLTLSVLFAAARPSLDGRAVVADENEMPKGLFARTIGYLPGDSVTVTNPANGSTVDVLILGSIDASEGVAILLSPEAASRLAIRKDSNVQVKITKRTLQILIVLLTCYLNFQRHMKIVVLENLLKVQVISSVNHLAKACSTI